MTTPAFLPLLFLFLSLLSVPLALAADPASSLDDASVLIQRVERENDLERLRHDHELFPLDQTVRRRLAQGYHDAGLALLRRKQYRRAASYFAGGGELYPDDPRFMYLQGYCSFQLKEYDSARSHLERARQLLPNDIELMRVMGLVLYDTDNRDQALELWRHALELDPTRKDVSTLLERAQRQMAVEAQMPRLHGSHFELTYDRGVDQAFAQAVLEELENAATQVGNSLGYFPAARVPVTIYTRSDYKTLTAAPDWSGGGFDGTIRLPFGSLDRMTPKLKAVLHHEYAHAVVFDMTHASCPVWLNEGIAELFGRRQYSLPDVDGELTRRMRFVDFRLLERGFDHLGARDARRAYQQSWLMVSYLVNNYGWHRVGAILTALGEGMTLDDAISRALGEYGLTYSSLTREWREKQERARGVARE